MINPARWLAWKIRSVPRRVCAPAITPNLARVSQECLNYKTSYSHRQFAPSRVTSRSQFYHSLTCYVHNELRLKARLIFEIESIAMKRAGYATHGTRKWGIGSRCEVLRHRLTRICPAQCGADISKTIKKSAEVLSPRWHIRTARSCVNGLQVVAPRLHTCVRMFACLTRRPHRTRPDHK